MSHHLQILLVTSAIHSILSISLFDSTCYTITSYAGRYKYLCCKNCLHPSQSSWSQAYNAGKLFAVLSLEKEIEEVPEKDYLNILGKELLETLEQEFFTLEVKDLESIKNLYRQQLKSPGKRRLFLYHRLNCRSCFVCFYSGRGKSCFKKG